jgi:upstream activation factor subunit UAF30
LIMAAVNAMQDSEDEEEEEEEVAQDNDSDYEKSKRTSSAKKRKADSDSDGSDYKPSKSTKSKKKKSSDDSDADWKDAKKKKKGKATGFTRPYKLSKELGELMGAKEMPRHEVVKNVWKIIKEKNLYDPKNKQFAICDEQLERVIGVKRFRTFGMMKYLMPHFIK